MMLPMEQQIRDAFAAEQALGPMAVAIEDIPISYEHITTDWLTAVMCKDVAGGRVTDFALGPADDGTNNRRRVELHYNAAGDANQLPKSVFCKATIGLRNRLMLAHSGGILCEVTFYRLVRPLLSIEAPRAFHASYDPRSFNSIIVLADLRGQGAFLGLGTHGGPDLAREQIGLLSAVHGRFYDHASLRGALAVLPDWETRFRGLMVVNLEEACATGLAEAKDGVPEALWTRRDEIWPATIASLAAQRDLPQTLCHGDVHLHNWYRLNDGTLGLGDWGVTHRGHWARDFVYMLSTTLTIDERRHHGDALLRLYLTRMHAAGGPEIAFDEAYLLIRQALMTALAFWTLTVQPVSEMPDMQPRAVALEFVKRLAHAVDDYASLDAF